MKKRTCKRAAKQELRREYDFSKLGQRTRGKYAARYREGTSLVLISPDVTEYFPDEQSVDSALRVLKHVVKKPQRRSR